MSAETFDDGVRDLGASLAAGTVSHLQALLQQTQSLHSVQRASAAERQRLADAREQGAPTRAHAPNCALKNKRKKEKNSDCGG